MSAGDGLWFSDFRNICQRNNPSLTFHYNDNTEKYGCGIFLHDEFIMGVPLGIIPEYTIIAKDGRILKRGWRATFGALLKKRLLKPDKRIIKLLGRGEIDSWQLNGRSLRADRITIQE